MHDELYWLSATELLRRYRSRELSPVEVIRTLLARIERLQPQLNAFVLVDPGPLAATGASEARWQRSAPLGLLDGARARCRTRLREPLAVPLRWGALG